VHFAHETAGAARTRSSLRPLFFEGAKFDPNLGRLAPRERGRIFEHHCATLADESEIVWRKRPGLRALDRLPVAPRLQKPRLRQVRSAAIVAAPPRLLLGRNT
jgi:hypothetical protein